MYFSHDAVSCIITSNLNDMLTVRIGQRTGTEVCTRLNRSLGLYVFRPAAMAMAKLGLQLAASIALAGLARSRLPEATR